MLVGGGGGATIYKQPPLYIPPQKVTLHSFFTTYIPSEYSTIMDALYNFYLFFSTYQPKNLPYSTVAWRTGAKFDIYQFFGSGGRTGERAHNLKCASFGELLTLVIFFI